MVLHEIKYDADVLDMVLHVNHKSMSTSHSSLTLKHMSAPMS
ncbi:hypothetical protein F383_27468 [Gossypium arboreum]|uniref:Uncharacterized protein n=1 Tax=Gossypium arboreum TaxID=29729 RepID=A0A0B0MTI0_GOSAR|nr:hypothetical protein F383_27468 [Gossypium arboreum]